MRAHILMEILAEERAEIVVPTIIVSELMVPIPAPVRDRFINDFATKFECVPFDLRASTIAARLVASRLGPTAEGKYQSRNLLKSDAMIIATAKAFGCDTFYSHDAGARKLAEQIMEVSDLPACHTDLFRHIELTRQYLGEEAVRKMGYGGSGPSPPGKAQKPTEPSP